MLLSGLGIVASVAEPYVLLRMMTSKFGDFFSDEDFSLFLVGHIAAASPFIVFAFLLSVASAVAAFGLFGHWQWARQVWLTLCVVWVCWLLFSMVRLPDTLVLPGMAIRIAMLIYSWRVLMNPSVRGKFTKAKMQVKC